MLSENVILVHFVRLMKDDKIVMVVWEISHGKKNKAVSASAFFHVS